MTMNVNLNRRTFLKFAGAALASGLFPKSSAHSEPIDKPNIVIIFADDLGYGDISGFGYEKSPFETPNLEKMAARGAKLTSFYVPTPYCAPSRASLLTGRYPFRNTVVFNPCPDAGINDVGLPASEITLAEALKPAGYATCCIGKWHLGHIPKFLPRTQGFDYYYGILYSNDMRPVQLVENETVVEYPVFQPTLTRRYTDKAIDFVTENAKANRPFFLYLPHAMPHKPLAASEEFYTPDTPDDLYADVIRELDYSIGRLLDCIRELRIERNTLVIFTSDNGPWYGGSTGGLRGMKAITWEGGHRVPFIAQWPGRIPAGLTNTSPVASVDVFPTVLKAVGIDIPDDRVIDGQDIFPCLLSSEPRDHKPIFGMSGVTLSTIRMGKWKLHVRNPGTGAKRGDDWIDPRGPDGVTIIAPYEQARPSQYPGLLSGEAPKAMMLFDIEADPGEQHDLAAQHRDIVGKLKAIFDKALTEVPEFERPKTAGRTLRIPGGALKYDL